MERTALIEDIQHKVATIENQEVLKELQEMIDGLLSPDRDNSGKLPIHVQESIARGKKQLDEGKGIPHVQIISEIRLKYPEIG
jgi:hypothetical protein